MYLVTPPSRPLIKVLNNVAASTNPCSTLLFTSIIFKTTAIHHAHHLSPANRLCKLKLFCLNYVASSGWGPKGRNVKCQWQKEVGQGLDDDIAQSHSLSRNPNGPMERNVIPLCILPCPLAEVSLMHSGLALPGAAYLRAELYIIPRVAPLANAQQE